MDDFSGSSSWCGDSRESIYKRGSLGWLDLVFKSAVATGLTYLDDFISVWRIKSETPDANSFFVSEPSLEICADLLALFFELGLLDLKGDFAGERDNCLV